MQKILVIQQKMIGDVLISSLICENLRRAYPDAQIDYMVYASTAPILEGHTSFDRVILFKPEYRNNKWGFIKFIKSVRAEAYDLVIDAYAKLESKLITFFSKAPVRISYDKGRSSLAYNHLVPRKTSSDKNLGLIIEHRLDLLKPLNLNIELITRPHIVISEEEKAFAEKQFHLHQINTANPVVMISAVGSEEAKTYPTNYLARVIDQVCNNRELLVLFNYLPSQISIAAEIKNQCLPDTQRKINLELSGGSLREFLAIMNHCDLIIGNDGGAINMAKALDKPAFSIFSPWIDKAGWATFEDGNTNISVHLKDFKPELFKNKSAKAVKSRVNSFYKRFDPALFKGQLEHFLQVNLS